MMEESPDGSWNVASSMTSDEAYEKAVTFIRASMARDSDQVPDELQAFADEWAQQEDGEDKSQEDDMAAR